MWFIDGPSLFADITQWEEHLESLYQMEKKYGKDESITFAIERAKRIIELIKNSDS